MYKGGIIFLPGGGLLFFWGGAESFWVVQFFKPRGGDQNCLRVKEPKEDKS